MGGRYQAYHEYKNSGTDWVGMIPGNWDSISIGRLFTRVKRTDHVDKELLSVYRDHGVVPKSSRDDNNNKPSDDLAPYQLVQPNDLVLNKMKTWQGSIAISEYEGIVSPAYFVYQPNAELFSKAHPKYIHYLLRNPLYIAQYLRHSKGIRVNQWDLDPDEFKLIELLLPQKDEQIAIINFLDHETAKIDTLIDKQQELIKLLKEKRQAVISHAVTKGLDPAAPMKDSGVEWLGVVPEHWVIISLGKITEDKCDGPFGSGLKSEHYTESGVLVVRLQNIKSGGYHEGEGAFIDENYYKYYLSNHDVVAGDVLIAGLGDPNNPVGRACVAPENIEPAMVKADCFRFRLNRKKVIPNFVARQLSVSAHVDAGRLSNGSTRARIPLNLMATRKVAICPLAEQGQILEHINALSEQYDKLEEAASKAVSLLQDRRTALISAAVTGKIDVRNWQPVGRERLITPPVLPLS